MKKYLIPAAIILVAAFFRLYRLNELPPGLHYDEAFNATMAQRVLTGVERPIYFTQDLTEEPMAIYTAATFFWLFGASSFSLRLVSAFAGILTVAAIYFLARGLVSSSLAGRGKVSEIGAAAAFILGILYWHINFSRLGMEPIFLPLMLTLGMGFLLHALRRLEHHTKGGAGWDRWALAGLFFALTQYTYKAALFVPIFIGALLLLEIIMNREFLKQGARRLAVLLAVGVLVFAPLGIYWVTHPGEFVERPATVLTSLGTNIQNTIKVGAMFFGQGDENPRSNLPGRAVLDPALALGFITGVVLCVGRLKRRESRVMLIWLGAMVLPSILTDFAPHFGRSIAAAPAVALITAYGFSESYPRILQILADLFHSPRFATALVSTAFVLLFSFGAFSTFNDYFNIWGARTGNFDAFDVGLLSLSQMMHSRPPNEALFFTPVERDHYTVQFGLAGADANSFDGAYALVLPEPGSAAAYGVITRIDARTLERLRKVFPTGRAVETIYDYSAQPYAVIFRTEGAGQLNPQRRLDVRVGDTIALMGYDVARTPNEIRLTIYWGSIAENTADYTVFVHLLDASGHVITQDDARPGHGSYRTLQWRAGQVIADDYHLAIPPGTNGAVQIEIGMYVLETGVRLRVVDANGAQLENDRVLIERFTLP